MKGKYELVSATVLNIEGVEMRAQRENVNLMLHYFMHFLQENKNTTGMLAAGK